jgi:PKD repeat protein
VNLNPNLKDTIMKTKKFQNFMRAFLLLGAFAMVTLVSCEKEDPKPEDPIASFQYAVSETNYLEVTFTNFSQNADSYSWAFGDGGTSTEANPVYTYTEAGSYTVVLTAVNSDDVSATYSQSINITDPNAALTILTGGSSKTWKLYREGTSMGIGPNAESPRIWWSLSNDGSRPCLYYQEFTFNHDGSFVFDDKGMFWGEGDVFAGTDFFEICFPAEAANMINKDGVDVSAFLSGTHAFDYNPTSGNLTLTGTGAWMGLIKLGTTDYVSVPQESITYQISVEEFEGYDLMTVVVNYPGDPEGNYWDFTYASYSNPALEPDVVVEEEPWGEDLEDVTPTALSHTFESESSFELLGAIGGASTITTGVDDPTDAGATKVGQFDRTTEMYQEAQLRISPDPKDIQFTNFTTAKIDIFVPADTEFAEGGLQRHFVFGFADQSQTQEWWNSPVQFVKEGEDVVLGAWTTYTFDLTDVKARTDLDMIYLGMGGGGHTTAGTFYIRNLVFE